MKNYILTFGMLLLAASVSNAQHNNIYLVPGNGSVCHSMEISLGISGNSFEPISYLWNTDEITPTISIVESGTYTLTVTGYLGQSKNQATITKSATYNVLPAPEIDALTNLWVCKNDTVRLAAPLGYDYIQWSDGSTGETFTRAMNLVGTFGFPALDTLNVFYTAGINNLCTATSETVMLRGIRYPHGVGRFYQGKMNINITDSIPAGLVLEYLYPVTYEMNFIDEVDPVNVINYVTTPGSIKAPASILTPGKVYTVETTPIINGQRFCTGIPSTIGIAAQGNRLSFGFTADEGVSTFRIYTAHGQLLMEKQAEEFSHEWLRDVASQLLIVYRTGNTSEVIKLHFIK